MLGRRVRATLGSAELPVLDVEISNRIAFAEAPAAGLGVTAYTPRDQASAETRALVDELIALGDVAVQPEPRRIAHA